MARVAIAEMPGAVLCGKGHPVRSCPVSLERDGGAYAIDSHQDHKTC